MRCGGVHGVANAAYLGDFLFSGLLRVARYCVPGGIRVVSKGRQCIDGPNPSMTLEMRPAMQCIKRLADLDVETIFCYHGVVGEDANGQSY
jgi:glyoxylase-like metal-dependent hydrolase (beta-lactamase superfamily II)